MRKSCLDISCWGEGGGVGVGRLVGILIKRCALVALGAVVTKNCSAKYFYFYLFSVF